MGAGGKAMAVSDGGLEQARSVADGLSGHPRHTKCNEPCISRRVRFSNENNSRQT
jgi:hypothetical protein